jgi:iron complex outermembrane receptor protein
MSIGCCVSLDAYLRYVDDLPDPATSDYTELTARLGWRVSSSLELSLNGLNLLHANHREYAEPAGQEITRNVTAELRWTF